MKLIEDFGVRALLATISGTGFYVILLWILATVDMEIAQLVALISVAQAPWLLALGFYFGTQIAKTS